VNILKVFEDFRQLSIGDQAKIVEWYNSQRGGEPSRNWSNASAQKVSDLKQEKYPPRKFSDEQRDFVGRCLLQMNNSGKIATLCETRWPNERSRDAWRSFVNERQRFMKEKGQS
jgi:hypothetical protein